MTIELEAQKSLAVEIFELSGYKVDADDPVIIAALFYSERLKALHLQHQKLLVAMFAEQRAQMTADIEVATKHIEAAAKQLASQSDAGRAKLERQYSEMLHAAKNAAHNEVPSIKRELEKFVFQLRRAALPKPRDTFNMTLAALCGSMALTAIGSVLATLIWFGKVDIISMRNSVIAYAHQVSTSETLQPPANERKAGQR